MFNNNIKILLVSFVHHINLQNFLNAPRKTQPEQLVDRQLVFKNFIFMFMHFVCVHVEQICLQPRIDGRNVQRRI